MSDSELKRPRRRWRRALIVAGGLLVLAVLSGLAGLWYLTRSPRSIDALRPRIESALSAPDGSHSVRLGETTLEWLGWLRGLHIRTRDTRIHFGSRNEPITIDELSLVLRIPSLLRGRIQPTELDISGVNASATRTEDGELSVVIDAEDRPAGEVDEGEQPAPPFLAVLQSPPDPSRPLGRLRRLKLQDLRLKMDDRQADLIWATTGASLEFTRDADGIRASASAEIDVNGVTSPLRAMLEHRYDEPTSTVALKLSNLRPALFERLSPALGALAVLDRPLDGEIHATLQSDGRFRAIEAKLEGTRGRVDGKWTPGEEPCSGTVEATLSGLKPWEFGDTMPELKPLENVRLPLRGSIRARIDDARLASLIFELASETGTPPESAGLRLTSLRLHGEVDDTQEITARLDLSGVELWTLADLLPDLRPVDGLHLTLDARIEARLSTAPVLHALSVDLRSGAGTIALPSFPRPLDVAKIEIAGSVGDELSTLALDKLQLGLDGTTITAGGRAARRGSDYRVELSASFDRLPTDRIASYWPPAGDHGAREWVTGRISEGAVSDGKVDLVATIDPTDASSLRFESLAGSFEYDGLTVDYDPQLPAATAVGGSARVTASGLDFDVTGGRAGPFEVPAGKVVITGLDDGPAAIALDLDVTGAIDDALRLLEREPLKVIDGEDLDASKISGAFATDLHLGLPLEGEIDDDTLDLSVEAELRGVGWRGLPRELELTDGELMLSYARSALEVAGEVRLSGIPTTVEYHERFDDHDPARRVRARATIDAAGRRRLGLPLGRYVAGPLDVTLDYSGYPGGREAVAAKLDLEATELSIPQAGWSKPAGETGGATFTAAAGPAGPWEVSDFRLSAADLQAAGSLRLKPDGVGLSHLELRRLELADSSIRGSLTATENDGAYDLRIEGSQLDLLPFLEAPRASDASSTNGGPTDDGAAPTIDLRLALGRVTFGPERHVDDVMLSASLRGSDLEWAEARATAGKDSSITAQYGPSGDEYVTRVTVSDLGQLLESLRASSVVEGGAVEVTAGRKSRDDPLAGRIELRKLEILRAPTLARLLRAASLTGLLDTLTSKGLTVNLVASDFTYQHRRLELNEGHTRGSSLGMTFEGSIDLAEKTADLNGVVTPFYELQSVVRHIPLVGPMITGGKHEGLVATLYTMTGPIAEPDIDVNAASALTPGFTRQLFDLFRDDDEQGDDD
jgi:hypothetical protein